MLLMDEVQANRGCGWELRTGPVFRDETHVGETEGKRENGNFRNGVFIF